MVDGLYVDVVDSENRGSRQVEVRQTTANENTSGSPARPELHLHSRHHQLLKRADVMI